MLTCKAAAATISDSIYAIALLCNFSFSASVGFVFCFISANILECGTSETSSSFSDYENFMPSRSICTLRLPFLTSKFSSPRLDSTIM